MQISFSSSKRPLIYFIGITSIQEDQHKEGGYWKFNKSLTNDPVFVNSLKEEINTVASCFDKEQDRRVNWEYLKYKMFRFSKDYANKKAEQRKEKQLYLENKVINLEKELTKVQICLRPF